MTQDKSEQFIKDNLISAFYKSNIPDGLNKVHAIWLIDMVDDLTQFNIRLYDKKHKYTLQNIQVFFTYVMLLVLFIACIIGVNTKSLESMHDYMKSILFAFVGLVFSSFGNPLKIIKNNNATQTLSTPGRLSGSSHMSYDNSPTLSHKHKTTSI